jgi:hypothetical protein
VGLEPGPLSLVSTIEELLGRNSTGSGLENRDYGRRGSITLTTWHRLSAKLALTSPTSGGRYSSLADSDHGVIIIIIIFFFFFVMINVKPKFAATHCHWHTWFLWKNINFVMYACTFCVRSSEDETCEGSHGSSCPQGVLLEHDASHICKGPVAATA